MSVWAGLADAVNPAHQRPRRRADLEFSRLRNRYGEDYVIVQNPQDATYRRLGTDELHLLELMDGTRSVQDLVVAYMMRYHRFALPLVLRLVRDLKAARLLVEEPRFVYGPLGQRVRRRRAGALGETMVRSFLRREFPVEGIDRVLTHAYRGGVWLLFTRPAVAIMVLIALVGLPLLATGLLGSGVVEQSLLVTLPLFYGFVLLIGVIHELAHAFTVKHHGRLVRRGGLSIFYGSPGLFVDTQDIWMEPRRARIAVSSAGPFSGLVLGGLAGLALAVAPDAPWTAALAVFGASAVLVNVLQLMPLIQLDGYYILMDWLDMPNLRSRAIGFVRHELAGKLRRRESFDRTERVFAVFGVLAVTYTGYVVVLAAGFAWVRAREVVVDAVDVPSFGSIAGAAVVLALIVPLLVMLVLRIRQGARSAWANARALRRLAAERRYRERVAALVGVPAIAELGKARVQLLARRCVAREYPPGALLPTGDLVLVLDGAAEMIGSGPALGPGDYLLPGHGGARAVRAVAVLELAAADVPAGLTAHDSEAERAELGTFALLDGLGPRDRDTLLTHLQPRSLADGETIGAHGEFHLVRSGTVVVRAGDDDVLTLRAGDHFGEAALLDGVPYASTAVAAGPTSVWTLDRAAFDDVLCRYFDLTRELADTGARRQARVALRGTATGAWLDVEVGQQAPDFRLESTAGDAPVALSDFRGRQTVLLWFSRGNNCPYCREYMRRLGAEVAAFRAAGVQILQVAPSSVEGAREFWRGHDLPFPFLCDPEKAAYRLCGLQDIGAADAQRNNVRGFAHAVAVGEGGATLRAVWLDLARGATGTGERLAHHGLTAMQQGVFLIDRDGVIRRKYVFGPLEEPPSNAELLDAAAELAAAELQEVHE